MTPSSNKNKNNFDVFKFELQVRLATAVKLVINQDPERIERLVNKEIDKMFDVLGSKNGGRFIGSQSQLSDWGVTWLPLNKTYEQTKAGYNFQKNTHARGQKRIKKANRTEAKPNTFYNNMGDLIRDMRGKSNKSAMQSMSNILGGLTTKGYAIGNEKKYTYTTARKEVIRQIKTGEIQKTSITQKVTLDMLGKLKKMKQPELIFGLENEKKLGLVNGHFTEWHRPFVREYALWYARVVITEKVRQLILNRKK